MGLDKVQGDVEEWVSQFSPKYWKIHEMLARLMEETGELSREVNHKYGPKKKKAGEAENTIGSELADILFTVACIANSEGIKLDDEWEKLMSEKQYGRDNDRYEKK